MPTHHLMPIHRRLFYLPALFIVTLLFSACLWADHHGWQVVEAFSNADGSLQFIELQANDSGHDGVDCCALVAGNMAAGGYEFQF